MQRIGLAILAALMLALTSIGAAVADHRETDEHGPPDDPPCEQGNAGENNPNCDGDGHGDGNGNGNGNGNSDGHGPPNNPPCDRGNAGEKNPNCDDDNGTPPPPPPPPPEDECPEGALIDQEIDGIVYACVILLPAADETAECPEGTIGPIAVPADPLVNACVVLGPDGDGNANGDGNGNANANANGNGKDEHDKGKGQDKEQGPPNDPPCDRGSAGEKNPNCGDGGTTPPPADECPEGALIDQEIGDVVYACIILLPEEDQTAECPDGTVPIALPENPLANACVVLGPNGS